MFLIDTVVCIRGMKEGGEIVFGLNLSYLLFYITERKMIKLFGFSSKVDIIKINE